MLWFDMVRRVRMERNGKWHLWPFHAHTTHHVKPQNSPTSFMFILRNIQVIPWR